MKQRRWRWTGLTAAAGLGAVLMTLAGPASGQTGGSCSSDPLGCLASLASSAGAVGDGCPLGSTGLISLAPLKKGEDLTRYFEEPCSRHDVCYASGLVPFGDCDVILRRELSQACEDLVPEIDPVGNPFSWGEWERFGASTKAFLKASAGVQVCRLKASAFVDQFTIMRRIALRISIWDLAPAEIPRDLGCFLSEGRQVISLPTGAGTPVSVPVEVHADCTLTVLTGDILRAILPQQAAGWPCDWPCPAVSGEPFALDRGWLSYGTPRESEIGGGDAQVWRFRAEIGDYIMVRVEVPHPPREHRLEVRVLNERDGTSRGASGSGSVVAIGPWATVDSGVYEVLVLSRSSSGFRYETTVGYPLRESIDLLASRRSTRTECGFFGAGSYFDPILLLWVMPPSCREKTVEQESDVPEARPLGCSQQWFEEEDLVDDLAALEEQLAPSAAPGETVIIGPASTLSCPSLSASLPAKFSVGLAPPTLDLERLHLLASMILVVPDLRGLAEAEAEEALADAGFSRCACEGTGCCRGNHWILGRVATSDPGEVGRVVGQSHPPGTWVLASLAMPLQVEVGNAGVADSLTVPDLSGMLRRDAEAVLRAAGFSECTTTLCRGDQWLYFGLTGADDPAELGKVADQYPKPGTKVPITLEVPGVRFWLGSPLVPDLVGRTAAEAAAEIERWHLRPSLVGPEPTSDPGMDGKVVRQSPPAGEMVGIGTRISYWIGEAGSTDTTGTTGTTSASAITLRDYTGWSCSAARADLQALGLVAPPCEFSWYVPYDSPLAGTVDSQEPGAGTRVARGSTVQLWALEAATTEAECDLCDGYWHCGCPAGPPPPGSGCECFNPYCHSTPPPPWP
ncbi:MAG: PASTA domain-containing protein [Actinomycetota bacterium]